MVRFAGNTVIGNSRNGIEVLDIRTTTDGSSMAFIENNTIVTGSVGAPTPTTSCPNGIVAGEFVLAMDATTLKTQHVISHNHVEMHGANLPAPPAPPYSAGGIVALTNNMIVEFNHIVVDGRYSNTGISLNGLSGCFVGENTIRGRGRSAMMVRAFQNPNTLIRYSATDNVLKGNNTSGFDVWDLSPVPPIIPATGLAAEFAAPMVLPDAVRYGADNNTLVGGHGTVLDLGIDNMIKGGFASVLSGEHVTMPGGVGQEISEEASQRGQLNQGQDGY
jgi:hypothetical protein